MEEDADMHVEEGTSGEADFAPMKKMRIRMDSVPSSSTDYASGFDGRIGGVDVSGQLPGPSTIAPHDEEYEIALDRFMRNEIDYDEFMRQAGGMPLNEEEIAMNTEEEQSLVTPKMYLTEEENDDDVEYVNGENEMDQRESENAPDQSLPYAVRNIMREVMLESMVDFPSAGASDSATPAAAASTSAAPAASGGTHYKQSRKLNATLMGLLGQANVIHARGNTKEALTMLLEVIRQEPRNGEAYKQVSDIYHDLNDNQKALQYGLLAAYLNARTPAGDWCSLGDQADILQCYEEAAACYGRAMRLEPASWLYCEKRISMLDRLNLRPLAMKTRLQAAQSIDYSLANLDFDWFHRLIKQVAEYYIEVNDEEKAVMALETFIVRSRDFDRSANAQHKTLIGMWITNKKYVEAAKSILALCNGIRVLDANGEPNVKVTVSSPAYTVEPFPPPAGSCFEVTDQLETPFICHLIVCFMTLGHNKFAMELVNILYKRQIGTDREERIAVVDVAKTFYSCGQLSQGRKFIEHYFTASLLLDEAALWFVYGNILMVSTAAKDTEDAMEAFEKVLQLLPSHVDARINLSGLQQRFGMADRALETLQGHDLEGCSQLPDVRLLLRQADFLFERGLTDQFVKCARMLLTPFFYEIHKSPEILSKKRAGRNSAVWTLSTTLRQAALLAIQNSPLEKFVKRLGMAADGERSRSMDEVDPATLHDYCLKLIECLLNMERYQDMLVVCCYAFLQPKITKHEKSITFQNLLYYCAIKAQNWPMAFEFTRWFHQTTVSNHPLLIPANKETVLRRIYNAMNFVFCHSQNVSYHRYIMRTLAKNPTCDALQAISGNNSLITGTYRHALGEFLRVWVSHKESPLASFLVGLTFTHMACKKDLSSRHMLAIRGLSFLKRYEETRSVKQEVFYNLGRAFHQMSMFALAIHFYQKAIDEPPPKVSTIDENGDEKVYVAEKYNLKRFAAHNLALIYNASGNKHLARSIYDKYLVV